MKYVIVMGEVEVVEVLIVVAVVAVAVQVPW